MNLYEGAAISRNLRLIVRSRNAATKQRQSQQGRGVSSVTGAIPCCSDASSTTMRLGLILSESACMHITQVRARVTEQTEDEEAR